MQNTSAAKAVTILTRLILVKKSRPFDVIQILNRKNESNDAEAFKDTSQQKWFQIQSRQRLGCLKTTDPHWKNEKEQLKPITMQCTNGCKNDPRRGDCSCSNNASAAMRDKSHVKGQVVAPRNFTAKIISWGHNK